MADGSGNKWRVIESEMNRFEAEISSLARQPNFIPAQLRRPPMLPHPHPPPGHGHPGHGFVHAQPFLSRPPAPRPMARPPVFSRPPGPTIISGAPKVYSSEPTTTTTKVAPPVSAIQPGPRPTIQHPAIRSLVPKQALFSQQQQQPPSAHMPMNINLPGINQHLSQQQNPMDNLLPGGGIPPAITPSSSSSITTSAIPSTSEVNKEAGTTSGEAGSSTANEKQKKKGKKNVDKDGKPKKLLRCAGGTVWEDFSLQDWDPSDFRLFCGDLGNDVTDEVLTRVFGRYPSFQKAKVVRDKRTNKTKGYGFVSFKDPNDFVRAIRELDGRYVGSRPIKLRKSNWKNRNIDQAKKRDRERNSLIGIKKPAGKR